MAFDIIDRVPAVESKKDALKSFEGGELRFENCDFTYSSRKDQKVLQGFSATF